MTHQRINPETRRAAALSVITDAGTTLDQIAAVCPFACRSNLVNFMLGMARDVFAFSCRAKIDTPRAVVYYFRTMEGRDAFHAAYQVTQRERAKERQAGHDARRKERMKKQRAAKAPKLVAKPAKVLAEKKPAPDVKKAAQANKNRVMAKPEKIPKLRAGTAIGDKPAYAVGPARRAGKLDLSRAKIIVAPSPPDRWSVSPPAAGGFAHLKPGQYDFPPASCAARSA